ncbi:MAG TPA: hypothetical protein VGL15_09730 [Vicinamibacteria bacterium]
MKVPPTGSLTAVVSITKRARAGDVDSEVRVRSLEELYAACREAPPSDLVKIDIRGPEGVVALNFASFIKS